MDGLQKQYMENVSINKRWASFELLNLWLDIHKKQKNAKE